MKQELVNELDELDNADQLADDAAAALAQYAGAERHHSDITDKEGERIQKLSQGSDSGCERPDPLSIFCLHHSGGSLREIGY